MNVEEIGNLIKIQRLNIGMTQNELAEKIYVSYKTVSKWECGNGAPDISILPRLAEALNLSIEQLLSGTKSKTDESLLRQSFDKEADDYEKNTADFHHALQEFVTSKNLHRELKKYRNPKILDAGCGIGLYSIPLLQEGYNVTLSDISGKSLEIARGKLEEVNKVRKAAGGKFPQIKTDFVEASVESLPFENESFDFVMMNGGVLSYVLSPEKALRECYRVLKKGGTIFFDYLNTFGWAIETWDAAEKLKYATAKNILIQMPDWDYPARLMSLDYGRQITKTCGFSIESEYGLINLSHSINLDARYGNTIPENVVKQYQKAELEYSRNPEMIGSAWSICLVAKKAEARSCEPRP